MPIGDQLKIKLNPDVSKYLDFIKMEEKRTFKDIIENLIIEKYKEVIKESL